jgi:phosphate transport system protein
VVRADFDRNLKLLQDDLLELGSLVSQAIIQSMRALKDRDRQVSQQVVAADDVIDKKRFQLEDQCIDLIATQQPIAIDLRTLMAVLHISVELERMGDYAEGIAKITLMMETDPSPELLDDLPELAERANGMLSRSLDALVRRDSAAAAQVCEDDDQVDNLYEKVYQELLSAMARNPRSIQMATYLLWVAHDLERIADRATNIAERVIFLVTGKLPEVNVSKY